MERNDIVMLVGHGGLPADAPRELAAELKRLEGARQAHGDNAISAREAELDRTLRDWPRTAASDPYQAGFEALAAALAARLERRLVVAYNEFCAPSIDQALAAAVADGARRITLLTTMVTPGGSHAEREIPAVVAAARERYPDVVIEYAWPFDLGDVAALFATHLQRHDRRR